MGNTDTTKYHSLYERFPEKETETVDMAYTSITRIMKTRGFRALGHDSAEELVAAITRYMLECNPEIALPPEG
jgi:hypothetical protein